MKTQHKTPKTRSASTCFDVFCCERETIVDFVHEYSHAAKTSTQIDQYKIMHRYKIKCCMDAGSVI